MLPFQRLPIGFHYALGRAFAWVAKYVVRYRNDVIVTNLSRSFPEKKYHEIERMRDDTYRHIGEIFAEAMWFGGCRNHRERLQRNKILEVDPQGAEAMMESYRESPSVMVLNSHLGNWELIAAVFDYIGMDDERRYEFISSCYVVYKKLTSKFWDRFIGENRKANLDEDYSGYVESEEVLRIAFRNKGKRRLYMFPTDQYPYGKAAFHLVPSFLNQPTKSMTGGAALAKKFGMAVYESCFVRMSRGHYKVVFEKICDDASLLTPEEIMEKYYEILEKYVRQDPGNYLWSHKRWK